MSSKLLIAFYLAAGALAFLIIVWMKRKPSEDETREVKNLAVKLPHFHHTGAFISAGVVAVTLVYLAFSNYSIGTTRQWWLLDMFDARHVKPYEQPMRTPAVGSVSTTHVVNYDRMTSEGRALSAPIEGDADNGERMYNTYCAPCHAEAGTGNGPVAVRAKTIPGIPLAGTAMQTEGYLYLTIRNGGAIMPSYYWAMTDAEMWDVVAYLRRLFPVPEAVAGLEE